eukprot:366462-Chlamydomonas_euryale.AAC.39
MPRQDARSRDSASNGAAQAASSQSCEKERLRGRCTPRVCEATGRHNTRPDLSLRASGQAARTSPAPFPVAASRTATL